MAGQSAADGAADSRINNNKNKLSMGLVDYSTAFSLYTGEF